MFDAIGFINARQRKKKAKYYIIPPSFFKKAGVSSPSPVEEKQTTKTSEKPVVEVVETPKITLNKNTKRASGLSLSSIRAKKEHQEKLASIVVKEEEQPKNDFTEEQLQNVWQDYVAILEKKKQFNLASILSIDTPTLNDTKTVIHLTFPNSTNKVELERNQYDLLKFLKEKLQNYDITFNIDINEVLEKKYAYTPIEKYEKLKEKNPDIELLKQTFNLDL